MATFTCTGKAVRRCRITRGRRKGETFTLHAGKSAKSKKAAQGKRLQRDFDCGRDKRTGRFVGCNYVGR